MVKKCFYCSTEILDNSVVDMCEKCMYQVWGSKMAKAIVDNMERERDRGNLDLGNVGEKNFVEEKLEETPAAEELIKVSEGENLTQEFPSNISL